jgi:CRP/FNR family transcriptional regulator, anaerobic regulatory protein
MYADIKVNSPEAKAQINEILKKVFPHLLHPQLVEEIQEVGQLMRFKEGDVLIDYGQYIRMAPLVLEGSLKIMRENDEGEELFLYFLNAGESCSMSFTCCLAEKRSSIRAVVDDDVLILGIPVQYVDQWISKYTVWKNFVLRSYDQRLMELIQTIDTIAFKKLDERLIDYLKQLVKNHDNKHLNITHQQIASDLNASREAVSRLLKKMEKMGDLILGRNKIEILDL